MKIRLTKIFTFEMAHALPGYDGACRHIHGHSFTLEVTVRGEPLKASDHPKNGMVIDFKDLKDLVNQYIVHRLDHALVLPDTTPPEVVDMIDLHFGKVIAMPFQPTCENLIAYIVEYMRAALPDHIELWRVKLSETATSYAEWCAADE